MTDVKRIFIISRGADYMIARPRREVHAFALTDDRGFISFASPVASQVATLRYGGLQRSATPKR